MSVYHSPSDWATVRGEKWRSQVVPLEAMLAPVNEPLVRALQLDEPYNIADIGCGAGGTTLEIFRCAPAGSTVHGFDISAALIASARARLTAEEQAIAFHLANVATAPGPAIPFHRLVSRFGIMFFDDPPAAFANLLHWLAPGGRFAFAAWGLLSANRWTASVREVVAEFIDVAPTDPQAPGPFRYANPETLFALLERAGFAELGVNDWRGKLAIGGKLPSKEAATFALAAFSNFGDLLAEAGANKYQAAHQLLNQRFSQHQKNGAVQLDACVHIFTGVRPLNQSS